ncbi:MAG: lamin tail domain-containing protein [Saprospiraceae bacterium]|nr:lamin tail domain-containing protein [Saprospiraceae bacterium]
MRYNVFLLFLLFLGVTNAQVVDNFDDGELATNPTWVGDTGSFIVDGDKKLRLNAATEGSSHLSTAFNYPDSFELNFEVKLEFSPSGTNFCRLYFLSTSPGPSPATSYFIQIGENGSADALRIYRVLNGTESLLASGTDGTMATDPAQARLNIIYRQNGSFTVSADYNQDGIYDEVVSFTDPGIAVSEAQYFGIQCVYTATRKDKFVFDNFEVKSYSADVIPPLVVSAAIENSRRVNINFNEKMDAATAGNINQYNVSGLGSPSSVTLQASGLTATLDFDFDLKTSEINRLALTGLKDVSGNLMRDTTLKLIYYTLPKPGEIILSEILFDPYVNREDFIEIHNKTPKKLLLEGLRITNITNGQTRVVGTGIFIEANGYLAFTKDPTSLQQVYLPPVSSLILVQDLPAFNNDKGNVLLALPDGSVLDSFSYLDDFHYVFDAGKNIEGVSLEKANLLPFLNDRSNWLSASGAYKYATPGYANSHSYDRDLPRVVRIEVVDDHNLKLIFDDFLESASALSTASYAVDRNIGSANSVQFGPNGSFEVLLRFDQAFSPTGIYELAIMDVADKNKNILNDTTVQFIFGLPPGEGELIVSEILFNPPTGVDDFVEVYNTSDHAIQLKGLSISNQNNGQSESIEVSYVLPPKSYVAVNEDTAALKNFYAPPSISKHVLSALPAFNVDEGNVTITNVSGLVLDSFNYHEDRHHLLIDKEDRKGVSLEKIRLEAFENSTFNWQSSAKAGNYATPGYENSNALEGTTQEETFYLPNKVFSPNGDALDDLLILQYQFTQPGYVANIAIYNAEGFKVKNLTNNELLGQKGVIVWDGTNDDGNRERLGIYIITGSVFDPQGKVLHLKKDCVLADFID